MSEEKKTKAHKALTTLYMIGAMIPGFDLDGFLEVERLSGELGDTEEDRAILEKAMRDCCPWPGENGSGS